MCVFVAGIEEFNEKKRGGSSLHDLFGINVWKPTNKVGVFLIYKQFKTQGTSRAE